MTSSSSLYGTVTTQNSSSSNSTSLYGEAGTPIPDSSGNVVVRGDLYVLSGNILTTATTGNIFPTNATTINLGNAATTINIGADSGTTTINNDLVVDGDLTINGTFIAPDAEFGNIQIAVVDDQTISTTAGELRLTSVSDAIKLVGTTSIYTDNTGTFGFLNQPTTVGAFLSATSLNLGATTGTTNVNNNLLVEGTGTFTGDINAPGADFGNITIGITTNNTINTTTGDLNLSSTNGVIGMPGVGTLSSDQSSFLLLNAPTTITAFDSATSLTLADVTGTTNIRNNLLVGGGLTADNGDFGNIQIAVTDNQTIDTTAGELRLGSVSDAIKLVGTTSVYTDNTGTFGLLNNPTTINAFLGATAINIGAVTGTTNINNNLLIEGTSVGLAPATIISYSESNNRVNRPAVRSTTGNASGFRVEAPNATTNASASITAFNTNDVNNGKFLNFNARGNVTTPLRILTGEYTSGVLGASGDSIVFVDGSNAVHASINPAGPTVGTDLITKDYFDTNIPNPSALVNGAYSFTLDSSGVLNSAVNDPVTIVSESVVSGVNSTFTLDPIGTMTYVSNQDVGGGGSTLTVGASSLSWVKDAAPLVLPAVPAGTWSLNADNTTSFPNYTFPAADGTADQVLKTDGAGILSWYSPSDLNTTYTIDATSTTGGANFNLVGSDASTDTIAILGSGATTVTRTDANTITISSTDADTTYTMDVSATTGGANLNLVGSDSTTDTVKFANGTGVTVAETDANTMTVSIGQPVATSDSVTFADLTLDALVNLNTATLTTTTTAANQVADSFVAATYRTCKYVIQITSGSAYQAVEALLVHDGSTAYINTYGDVRTGANLTSINAAVNGANIELQVTPVNAATTYKISKTLIAV